MELKTQIIVWFKDGHQEVIESSEDVENLMATMLNTGIDGFIGFKDIDSSMTIINTQEISIVRLVPKDK